MSVMGAPASLFAPIDWQRLWLAPLRSTGEPVIHSRDWRAELNILAAARGLRNHRGLAIQFVPQQQLPSMTAYEAFISATGCVPTRDNLHDFFNALVWLTFPNIKAKLNALQAAEIEKAYRTSSNQSVRGRVRDAATIFDENSALLIVQDESLLNALRARRWKEVFVEKRDVFMRTCQVRLFGHALMEKLVKPYKAITAHVWPIVIDASFFKMTAKEQSAWIDMVVVHQLVENLGTDMFTPLPVLGVPDWWNGQDEAFYDDKSVFRISRIRFGEGEVCSERTAAGVVNREVNKKTDS